MKRLLFLLCPLLTVAGAAHAQFEVRLGGNAAKLHTTEGQVVRSNSTEQLGYQVGVTYQLPLTSFLSLVPEVQYSLERMRLYQASTLVLDASFRANTRLRLHYVNVPVLARATFGPVYVEAGPQAGLLLGGRQTGSNVVSSLGSPTPTEYEIDQGVTDNNRRFDIGPCLGVGLKLPAGLGVNVRAYQGLVTLNEERSAADGKFKRQSLQASLTYQLPRR
jgi:hypothetical protein